MEQTVADISEDAQHGDSMVFQPRADGMVAQRRDPGAVRRPPARAAQDSATGVAVWQRRRGRGGAAGRAPRKAVVSTVEPGTDRLLVAELVGLLNEPSTTTRAEEPGVSKRRSGCAFVLASGPGVVQASAPAGGAEVPIVLPAV